MPPRAANLLVAGDDVTLPEEVNCRAPKSDVLGP